MPVVPIKSDHAPRLGSSTKYGAGVPCRVQSKSPSPRDHRGMRMPEPRRRHVRLASAAHRRTRSPVGIQPDSPSVRRSQSVLDPLSPHKARHQQKSDTHEHENIRHKVRIHHERDADEECGTTPLPPPVDKHGEADQPEEGRPYHPGSVQRLQASTPSYLGRHAIQTWPYCTFVTDALLT